MKKKINLEEILFNELDKLRANTPDENWFTNSEIKNSIQFKHLIKAMKEACRQTLELAAENALPRTRRWDDNGTEVNKDSILNTINQIE